MPGILGPENFPIRDPKDPNQTNGRNINPVRMPELGGSLVVFGLIARMTGHGEVGNPL